jgi:hypothetical protein
VARRQQRGRGRRYVKRLMAVLVRGNE